MDSWKPAQAYRISVSMWGWGSGNLSEELQMILKGLSIWEPLKLVVATIFMVWPWTFPWLVPTSNLQLNPMAICLQRGKKRELLRSSCFYVTSSGAFPTSLSSSTLQRSRGVPRPETCGNRTDRGQELLRTEAWLGPQPVWCCCGPWAAPSSLVSIRCISWEAHCPLERCILVGMQPTLQHCFVARPHL